MKRPRKNYLEKRKTPYFLFSKQIIKKQIANIRSIAKSEVIYPFKTNKDKKINNFLKSLVDGFLVSSLEEIGAVNKIKKKDNRILFMDHTLTKEEATKVIKKGVGEFIVDSEKQLKLLFEVIEKRKTNVDIYLRFSSRVKARGMFRTEDFFGIKGNEIIRLLKRCQQHDYVNKIGIHNYLMSQNTNLNFWKQNLKEIEKLIWESKKEGIKLDSINLGGGLPIDYGKGKNNFTKIRTLLKQHIKKYKKAYPEAKIVFEPGRFVLGPSGLLVTKIKHIRDNTVSIDDSSYTSSMDTLVTGLELPCYTTSKSRDKRNYIIRGRSPCSLDVFRKKARLNRLKEGDFIIFYNAGAYTYSSDFATEKKTHVYLI